MERVSIRSLLLGTLSVLVLLVSLDALRPSRAAAGGTEFPADGTRNLGRGAAGMARADDGHVMLRNPALLADLWDDTATATAHVLLVDSCFRPTGAYGMNSTLHDVIRLGNKDVDVNDPKTGFVNEPYPTVCYEGPTPVLPTLALTRKLAPNLGWGLGFFPPDTAALNQWGNPDGTVNTPNGLRPNPTRYFRAHLNTSFLTALTAVGYRPTDWLRIGVGFQWTMVAFTSYTYARPTPDLNVRNDIRTKADGKDLFIPGLIASVHVVPNDSLDIAAGFKWSDRVRGDTSLDLTAGSFGTGRAFTDSDGKTYGSTVPTTAKNQLGSVDSPPIWVPQLSFGVRYADRLVPRTTTKSWEAAHLATAPDVQDHMATERFDVEADAVVYFNSANDQSSFSNDAQKAAMLQIVPVDAMGNKLPAQQAHVGECTKWDAMHVKCLGQWKVPLVLGGKNQVSLRVGGDYNVLPDFFTVRAGMSYETNGINPEYFDVTTYMMGRTGLHAGFTLRLFDKTDFSFAFAHFIQKSIRLQINPKMQFSPRYYKNAMGVDDPAVGKMYNYVPGKHDGVAKWEAPYGNDFGPNFVNAGSYYYDLDVVSFALSQHF